jgi:hypothetical protein
MAASGDVNPKVDCFFEKATSTCTYVRASRKAGKPRLLVCTLLGRGRGLGIDHDLELG